MCQNLKSWQKTKHKNISSSYLHLNLKVRYKKALGLNPACRPSKALGQNFLRDQNLARKIAEAGDIQAGDLVLEIGPGEGILTAQILARGARVVAVEKDERLCKLLAEKFANQIQSGSLVLVHDDILKLETPPTPPLTQRGGFTYLFSQIFHSH